jgi:hypothetical protein
MAEFYPKRLPDMIWTLSHKFDPTACDLADRHYNRRKIGSPQFVPPGRALVLLAPAALWVTSWPFAEYVRHEWAGAWVNSCFRREAGEQASAMITDAIRATLWRWESPPEIDSAIGKVSMVTFINRDKVRPKRDYGRCYRKAGFEVIGETKGGLLALGFPTDRMPEAEPPHGAQETLLLA